MKRGRKLSVVFSVLMVLMLMFSACGNGATESQTPEKSDSSGIKIGFIPMNLNNEFYVYMQNGAQEKADELGVKLVVQGSLSGTDMESQLEFIENMIASGVDAIVISPAGSDGLTSGLKKCEDAGIPVINVDSGFDKDIIKAAGLKPIPFIGSDDYAGTKLAGEYVAENFPGSKVAIITGATGIPIAIDREKGFTEGLNETCDIVAVQAGDWNLDIAYTATQNIITANPDLDIIFCSSDQMAVGAIQAINAAGKAGDIKVLSYDGVSAGLSNVKSGAELLTVAQFPVEMGIQGVQAAYDAVQGKEVPLDTRTGNLVITKDNVAEYEAKIAPYGGE